MTEEFESESLENSWRKVLLSAFHDICASDKKSPHGDSIEQRNMRTHVMERNRAFWYNKDESKKPGHYCCDICGRETNNSSDYINSHIIAHAHAKTLREAWGKNQMLPSSTSYDYNGLFLCRDCDAHYEDHAVTINGDGTIVTHGDPAPQEKYRRLNGKKVKWAKRIGKTISWPNAATLEYHNTLPAVVGKHRQHLFGVESDDYSTASESEIRLCAKRKAEEVDEIKPYKVKRGRDKALTEETHNKPSTCSLSGCRNAVHVFDPSIGLYLCGDHADVEASEIQY